ncbi:MAG: hypothetical protein J6T08_09080 [Lentisphaeria bacterium]|nr:hypothetical protein [Lentisphaeria bacterium]
MAISSDTKKILIYLVLLAAMIAFVAFFVGDESPEEKQQRMIKQELTHTVYDIIRAKALIPDSVDFKESNCMETYKGYTVTGTFETKNAYGTMIPHKYSAEFNKDKQLIKIDIR